MLDNSNLHACCNLMARETATMGRGKSLDKHIVAPHKRRGQLEQVDLMENIHHWTEITDTETDHSSCSSPQN